MGEYDKFSRWNTLLECFIAGQCNISTNDILLWSQLFGQNVRILIFKLKFFRWNRRTEFIQFAVLWNINGTWSSYNKTVFKWKIHHNYFAFLCLSVVSCASSWFRFLELQLKVSVKLLYFSTKCYIGSVYSSLTHFF